MPRPPYFTPITILASGWLLATAACAAELGDIAVRSFIGQPLSADIELVQLAPDEMATLQVRLAQENVFRGANISMNPALASLHLAIVRREQRQFLRLSTTRPIDAEYVHLFLELGPAGRQEVRAATVWLQTDPNPAQRAAPAAVSAALPAPAPLPVAPAVLAEAAVNRTEALPAARPRAAPMPSLHESEIGTPGGLRASAAPPVRRPVAPVKAVPTKAASEHDGGHAEASLPLPVAQALLPLPGLPLPKSVKRAPALAACTPAPAGGAKECAALEAHSVELKSKLVELEGKVKVLQGALGAPPLAAKAAPVAAPVSAAASASAFAHGEASGANHREAPVGVKGELAKAREAANAARGEAGSASASASASAEAASDSSAAASEAASVPVKKVKVLPKLKYKKEKPPEPAPSSKLALIAAAGAAAVVVLSLAGWLFWRKKRGAAPLKIWQGFRKKKKAAEPEVKHEEAPPLEDVTPESLMQ